MSNRLQSIFTSSLATNKKSIEYLLKDDDKNQNEIWNFTGNFTELIYRFSLPYNGFNIVSLKNKKVKKFPLFKNL